MITINDIQKLKIENQILQKERDELKVQLIRLKNNKNNINDIKSLSTSINNIKIELNKIQELNKKLILEKNKIFKSDLIGNILELKYEIQINYLEFLRLTKIKLNKYNEYKSIKNDFNKIKKNYNLNEINKNNNEIENLYQNFEKDLKINLILNNKIKNK